MKRFPFCLLALFALAGCAAIPGTGPGFATSAQLASFSSIDSAYAAILGQEYRMMTGLFRANGYRDAASKFDIKANVAGSGQWVFPDTPLEAESEQARAYGDLNEALMFVMSKENAPWLAKAQVNYDCWSNIPSEDGCRRNFDRAMHSLILPQGPVRTNVVYFETDSSEIMPETHQTLETLAGQVRMSRNVLVRLDGHSSGGAKNQSLALRRAIAVRNMIAQMGVPPDRITVDNEAHADTMLSRQKSEKGANMQDCRVDIFLEMPSGTGI